LEDVGGRIVDLRGINSVRTGLNWLRIGSGPREHSYEHWTSIKDWEFINQLSDCQFLGNLKARSMVLVIP
jgi:hypothetical protein